MSGSPQRISTETALRLLAKQQRRQILRRVADTPDGTTVDQLKTHLGGTDSTNPSGNGTVDDQFTDIYHVHLPMLQEANVVVYDASRGTVQCGQEFQEILSLLHVIDSHRGDPSTTRS